MELARKLRACISLGITWHGAVLLIALCAIVVFDPHGRSQSENNLANPDWTSQWQRELGAHAGMTYVGSSACASCHSSITNMQASTGMAQAALDRKRSSLLSQHPSMSFRDGPYTLRIERRNAEVIYSATDGRSTLSVPVLWAFGLGNAGQTYIFEHAGVYYESRVSYYSALQNLDITIGHLREIPSSLLAALGRPLPAEEVNKCFSCHTSEDVFEGKLNISQLHPGVTCENCHGPGSAHLQTMEMPQGKNLAGPNIFNPGMLAPADLNDFCGTCHHSTRDVLAINIRDIRNIRFQPYRLENSRCYDPSDKRITCIACHDPHRNLVTSSTSYDSKCLACHQNRGEQRTSLKTASACPKETHNCVTCHMPKLVLPGAHYAFTDHYIRINRRGQPYPG
jgi:hypothetical protein